MTGKMENNSAHPTSAPTLKCHIVIVTPYYWPITSACTHLMKALFEGLATDGRRVTVLTNGPRSSGAVPQDVERGGSRIIRAWNPFVRRNGVLAKLCEYLWFFAFFIIRGMALKDVDIIFVVSTPPLAGLPATLLARLKGAKLIYNLQDLFPDSAVVAGMLRPQGLAYGLLRKAEIATYRVSDMVTTISPSFLDHVRKLAPNTPVATIPNWVDTDIVRPLAPSENPFSLEYLPIGKFIVLYAGVMGFMQNLEIVIESASILKEHEDIQFVFIGDGNAKQHLKDLVEKSALANCSFWPLQPLDKVKEVYNACDVGVIPLKPGAAMIAVPSKTWNYLACAKPVIGCVEESSFLAATIRESRAGAIVPPNDPSRLAQVILEYRDSPSRAAEEGSNGRKYVEERLSRSVAIQHYTDLFEGVLGGSKS